MSDSESVGSSTPKKSSKSKERYAEKIRGLPVIANPLASRRMTKHILKLVRKASKEKGVRRGVKEVVKAIRRDFKGICVIAGDIFPFDVITHLPILCEEKDIKYIFVPSKEDLGAANLTKRPTSCVLILPKENSSYEKAYKQVSEEIEGVWSSLKF